MMMSFNDFFHEYKLKNRTTSKMKTQQVFSSLGLNGVGIYLSNESFSSDIGIVNLHPSKRTHWVAYRNEFFLIDMDMDLLKRYLSSV